MVTARVGLRSGHALQMIVTMEMETEPHQPQCGHVGSLSFTKITATGSSAASRPIPCRAEAAFRIDGQHYRCADHVVSLLAGGGSNPLSITTAHHVDKLDAPIRDLDEVLTAVGVQCTLDRFQEWHATTAGRIELIAHQRDQLVAAMEWLEADPTRIAQVSSEIERQKAVAKRNGEAWAARASGISVSEYIDMQTPTIRQVIATLMAPTVDHDALNAKIFAIEHPLPADAS